MLNLYPSQPTVYKIPSSFSDIALPPAGDLCGEIKIIHVYAASYLFLKFLSLIETFCTISHKKFYETVEKTSTKIVM